MNDPVQSIRIAKTLVTRFGVLAVQTAHGAVSVDEQELRIGEGNQIYSELWRHLDDARAALVARGADVAVFDRIRAEEGTQLAVGEISTVRYRGRTVSKTASFNLGGHARASAACEALMHAMPEVDFGALERAEDAEIAKFGSLGPSRASTVLMYTFVVALAGIAIVGLAYWLLASP